jgi:hypothetical protein
MGFTRVEFELLNVGAGMMAVPNCCTRTVCRASNVVTTGLYRWQLRGVGRDFVEQGFAASGRNRYVGPEEETRKQIELNR